jgi:rhamnulokinase
VHGRLPFADLYALTGLQFLPFNTVYQLAAAEGSPQLSAAKMLLLIPDLVGYWLTGQVGAELTNASTTALLDVRAQQWSQPVLDAIGLAGSLLPALRRPGDVLGALLPGVREETGLGTSTRVVSVGSHDTASAVVAVPMRGDRAAYISLGTWGLVGVELDAPVLSDASREANFTNELGVDGRVRYLRNVMGLWLLQESMRVWGSGGQELATLLAAAAEAPKNAVFDVDDPRLLAPGDMPARICALIDESDQQVPQGPVQIVRSIVDSLAAALARTLHDAARLSGRQLEVVHVVGGGAQNALLCQLLADVAGLPVIAGPVEATALGNVLVQARAHGTLSGDLDELRLLVHKTQRLTRYEPRT